ncbi:MAG: patatin-like phospholipase family protein [Cellulophaga sp.]
MLKIKCIAFFLFFQSILFSQNIEEKEVKVGLVLSGGGAKGLAHIGAIKVIEEAGVKIDYIGGTSMGAIVGALYASGYSAKELDSIFRVIDFDELIKDDIPRKTKTYYEKTIAEKYALTLPFNNFKISIPQAISSGQNIYNELVRLLYHVKDVRDFKKLPIPFLCVATDIETGEEVLFKKGYLPEVIMASGTFPSLFEPAEIEGRILVDGGVVNNYPVREVLDAGANVIIGVDVQQGLSKRESLTSAMEIILQINNYRTVKDMVEKSKSTDIYIKPDMDGYTVIDFGMGEEIIYNGVFAAREKFAALEELAKKQKGRIKTRVNSFRENDSITIKELLLHGNNNYTRGYIKGTLKFDLNKKITFKKLTEGINNLSATGNFKTIRYSLQKNADNVDLVLNLKENSVKNYIRLGIHYDDLYLSSALINLTRKNLLMNDDVGSIDFIIGDNIRYNMEYHVDKGIYWSFGVKSAYNEFEKQINYSVLTSNFDAVENLNINTVNFEASDLTNQFYVQTILKKDYTIRLGVEHKYLKYSTKTLGVLEDGTANPEKPEGKRTFFEKSNYFAAYGRVTVDTYNNKHYPSKGVFFEGDFHFYLFSSNFIGNFKEFPIAKARMGGAFSIFPKLALNIETEGGFKLGTSEVKTLDFVLGGYGNKLINNFTPFFGYDFLSLPGNSYVKAYGRLDYEFIPKNHILFAANFANVDDDLFRLGDWFTAPDYTGYAFGYGLESFIGPVEILYSWSPEGKNSNFYFSIGFWF